MIINIILYYIINYYYYFTDDMLRLRENGLPNSPFECPWQDFHCLLS